MPLTYVDVHPQLPSISLGNVKAVLKRITPDTAYLTGGEVIEAGDVGLTEIFAAFVNTSTDLTATTTVVPIIRRTDENTWTLKLFESAATGDPLIEQTSGANNAAMRFDVLFLGV